MPMITLYSSISWLFVSRIISPNNLPTLLSMCKQPKNWGITDMHQTFQKVSDDKE